MKIQIRKTDVVYFDMDGVLATNEKCELNFKKNRFKKGYFLKKELIEGALEALQQFHSNCEVYLLSTPVSKNTHCYSEKRIWVEKHLGEEFCKRLILSHNKALNMGKLLIDDSKDHGAAEFTGIHLHFGQEEFANWEVVLQTIEFIE